MVLPQLMNRIHFPRPIIAIPQVIKITTFQMAIITIFLMRHLTPLIATETDRLIPMNFVNLLVHKTNKSIITRNSFFAEIFSFRFVYYQWKKNKKKGISRLDIPLLEEQGQLFFFSFIFSFFISYAFVLLRFTILFDYIFDIHFFFSLSLFLFFMYR